LCAENLWAGLSMPGNEAGDRVHNFFGQENLSQGQYHSQAVDGNWPGLSNNLWAGSQRPIGVPFISNLKNFNQQQSGKGSTNFNLLISNCFMISFPFVLSFLYSYIGFK